jgi:hypothetical protein
MLTERGQHVPTAVHPIAEVDRAAGAGRGMSSEEVWRHLESEQRLTNAAEEGIEGVMAATPNKRAADTIKKANEYLGLDANVAQLIHVANHIRGFTRDAVDFLTRGDNHGLESAIVTLWNGIRDADKLATPKPPLMPSGENIFYNNGWSTQEELGLRNILREEGDRCTAINADGATLASGKRVSRKAALDAYIPPAGGTLIAVGSLPQVMAGIRARELGK